MSDNQEHDMDDDTYDEMNLMLAQNALKLLGEELPPLIKPVSAGGRATMEMELTIDLGDGRLLVIAAAIKPTP